VHPGWNAHLEPGEQFGLKPFERMMKINLDGKLAALVGPNEARKTSILAAFERPSPALHCPKTHAGGRLPNWSGCARANGSPLRPTSLRLTSTNSMH